MLIVAGLLRSAPQGKSELNRFLKGNANITEIWKVSVSIKKQVGFLAGKTS